MCLFAKDSRNCHRHQTTSWHQRDPGKTHHLQLILPKLLLPGLVEEREIAHVMHEDVP